MGRERAGDSGGAPSCQLEDGKGALGGGAMAAEALEAAAAVAFRALWR